MMSRPISRNRSNSGNAATAAARRCKNAPLAVPSAFCSDGSASARAAFCLKDGEVSWTKWCDLRLPEGKGPARHRALPSYDLNVLQTGFGEFGQNTRLGRWGGPGRFFPPEVKAGSGCVGSKSKFGTIPEQGQKFKVLQTAFGMEDAGAPPHRTYTFDPRRGSDALRPTRLPGPLATWRCGRG